MPCVRHCAAMSTSNTPRRIAWSVAAGLLVAATPSLAAAHFFLEEPENWVEQGTLGDPQKTGPCGNEAPGRPTGAITAYQTGQTITIRFRETIYHPGHFRVALATADRSELPPMPTVPGGSRSDCGSIPSRDPPVFPVLADGLIPHTSPLSGVQEMEVTLPEGVTCDHCTLQIVQWMHDHGAPCFYYHCADLSISDVVVDAGPPSEDDAAVSSPDAATSSELDAASAAEIDSGATVRADAGPSSTSGGCACSVAREADARGALVISGLVVGALVRRRRRR